MKNLKWDDSLSVEVDEIDEDHRRLVDLFNLLSQSVEKGDDADYIEALLEELISCTVWHFRHEERLMLRYKYDGFQAHKAEHRDLIGSAKALQLCLTCMAKQRVSLSRFEGLRKCVI